MKIYKELGESLVNTTPKAPNTESDDSEEDADPGSVYRKPMMFSPSSDYSETSSEEDDPLALE